MRMDVKVALIGAVATIGAALIGFLAADPLRWFGGDEEQEVSMPPVAEPERLVAVPIMGTAVMFQKFSEDFEQVELGWPFDRDHYLEGGRLHIHVDELSGAVHPFLNQHYQIGKGAFAISVQAEHLGGADWTYGIVLKAVGRQEFLFLSMRKDGSWRISHLAGGTWNDTEWQSLPEGWSSSTTVTLSNLALENPRQPAELMGGYAETNDENLFVYADSILLNSFENPMQDVGKQFGVFSTMNVHAAFDNLAVYDLSQQQNKLIEGSCVSRAGTEYCP